MLARKGYRHGPTWCGAMLKDKGWNYSGFTNINLTDMETCYKVSGGGDP